jgi:hypothetical protein
MGSASHGNRVAVGQLRRLEALGTTSLYRVVAVDDALVRAEVVDVPGLTPGMTVRLTRSAVAAMELVDAPSASRPGPIADAA